MTTPGVKKRKRRQFTRARKTAVDRQLDEYAGELLKFHEWCELRGMPFRWGMLRAIAQYREFVDGLDELVGRLD